MHVDPRRYLRGRICGRGVEEVLSSWLCTEDTLVAMLPHLYSTLRDCEARDRDVFDEFRFL